MGAPPILRYLMLDEASRQVTSEGGLALTLECLKSVEILMTSPNLAPDGPTDNRPEQLLVFLIPVLIGHLMESVKDLRESGKLKLQLHDHSLKKMQLILQKWPLIG